MLLASRQAAPDWDEDTFSCNLTLDEVGGLCIDGRQGHCGENSKSPSPLPGVSLRSSCEECTGLFSWRRPADNREAVRPIERHYRRLCLSQFRPYFFFRRKEVEEVALSTGVAWLIALYWPQAASSAGEPERESVAGSPSPVPERP